MKPSSAIECRLCPRACGADRTKSVGFCRSPARAMAARAAPHFGEEPCISGTRGSGTVFFTGCTLRCVFCQNHAISRGGTGQPITVPELRELFLRLRDTGVHNLNLVTAGHFALPIAEALAGLDLGIPVVWNSSGYERVDTLRQLEGLVQVYLPDFKYADAGLSARFSGAPDYPQTALAAILEMYRQTGPAQLDEEGLLRRGILIRHLILPGHADNTLKVIDLLEDNLPPGGFLFSLMSQYTPMGLPEAAPYPELSRPVSRDEFSRCMSYLDFSSLSRGFWQEPEAATPEMIPAFDGTGLKPAD